MTKEGRDIAQAFVKGENMVRKRTYTNGGSVVFHASSIAHRDEHGMVWVSLCGYPTATTRDRVNAVLDAYGADWHICQRKGQQYQWFWRTDEMIPISSTDRLPIAGLLGMMVLRAERGLPLL